MHRAQLCNEGFTSDLEFARFKLFDFGYALGLAEGDLAMLKTVARMLRDQIAIDLPVVRRLCAQRDCLLLVRALHRLKGSLSYLGPSPAYRACERLESLAAQDLASELDSGESQLMEELDALLQELLQLACI